MDFLGDLQAGIGNIAKAFLVIRYYSYEKDKDGNPKALPPLSKSRAAMIKTEKKLVTAAANALKSSTSPSSSLSSSDVGKDFNNKSMGKKPSGSTVTFTVQYNPSSIKIGSVGGEQKIFGREGMGQAGEGIVSSVNSPIMTTLKFKLIFESINQQDAFIRESEDILGAVSTVGNLAGTGMNIYNKVKDNGGNSVKKQVEALMGSVLSDYTRDMIFAYGGTIFHGVLTGCSVNYKMFNKAGEPILAEVDMTMKQSTNNQYDNDRWNKAFDEYFGNDSISMESDEVKNRTKKQKEDDLGLDSLFGGL